MTNVHSTKHNWLGEMQICFFSIYSEKLDMLLKYRKSSIKPPKGLFLSIRFYGGFNREVGGGGGALI